MLEINEVLCLQLFFILKIVLTLLLISIENKNVSNIIINVDLGLILQTLFYSKEPTFIVVNQGRVENKCVFFIDHRFINNQIFNSLNKRSCKVGRPIE